MTTLRFEIEWRDPAPTDAAFGPEGGTWASLAVRVDDAFCTRNHSADTKAQGDRDYVVGPLSGLAEWVVEAWPHLLWEFHTPFPKAPIAGKSRRIPSARDAANLWRSLEVSSVKSAARWQHRHTLGHASSSLALPSIVFVPEHSVIGVSIDHIPPALDPSIRFDLHDLESPEPLWIPRDAVAGALSEFVDAVISHAQKTPASQEWADWLKAEWSSARRSANEPAERRRLMYGDFVATRWNELSSRAAENLPCIEGLLLESDVVEADADLQELLKLTTLGKGDKRFSEQRAQITSTVSLLGRAYEQGYALAQRLREFIKNETDPITNFEAVANNIGVSLLSTSFARCKVAAVKTWQGNAGIAVSSEFEKQGVAPTRFAMAAALGRLLAEASDGAYGAAHSVQSRWQPTRRANAFAAEFLLPTKALGAADISDLSERYGISRSAATWHSHNRAQALEQV